MPGGVLMSDDASLHTQRPAANIQFTDRMDLEVVESSDAEIQLRLKVPMFVWLYLSDFELMGIAPVFYLDTHHVTHEMRGAIEAACEEAWLIFHDVFYTMGPGPYQDSVLPVCHLREGRVSTTPDRLAEMAKRLRTADGYVQHREMALLAEGFEKVLDEGNQE